MRVVLDPNVLVSGLIGRATSSPRLIVNALADDELRVVVSRRLLAELEDVLGRPKFDAYVSREQRAAYVARIKEQAELAEDPDVVDEATRDPKDDYLVALARAERVDVIVSGDKDVLEAALDDPPAWTPREMADRLQGATRG